MPRAAKDKLSFKEKHALDTLPKAIAALEARKAKLRALLDDPTLYARDPAGFAKHSDSFGKAEADLAAAEEQWLTLEMRREALGS